MKYTACNMAENDSRFDHSEQIENIKELLTRLNKKHYGDNNYAVLNDAISELRKKNLIDETDDTILSNFDQIISELYYYKLAYEIILNKITYFTAENMLLVNFIIYSKFYKDDLDDLLDKFKKNEITYINDYNFLYNNALKKIHNGYPVRLGEKIDEYLDEYYSTDVFQDKSPAMLKKMLKVKNEEINYKENIFNDINGIFKKYHDVNKFLEEEKVINDAMNAKNITILKNIIEKNNKKYIKCKDLYYNKINENVVLTKENQEYKHNDELKNITIKNLENENSIYKSKESMKDKQIKNQANDIINAKNKFERLMKEQSRKYTNLQNDFYVYRLDIEKKIDEKNEIIKNQAEEIKKIRYEYNDKSKKDLCNNENNMGKDLSHGERAKSDYQDRAKSDYQDRAKSDYQDRAKSDYQDRAKSDGSNRIVSDDDNSNTDPDTSNDQNDKFNHICSNNSIKLIKKKYNNEIKNLKHQIYLSKKDGEKIMVEYDNEIKYKAKQYIQNINNKEDIIVSYKNSIKSLNEQIDNSRVEKENIIKKNSKLMEYNIELNKENIKLSQNNIKLNTKNIDLNIINFNLNKEMNHYIKRKVKITEKINERDKTIEKLNKELFEYKKCNVDPNKTGNNYDDEYSSEDLDEKCLSPTLINYDHPNMIG